MEERDFTKWAILVLVVLLVLSACGPSKPPSGWYSKSRGEIYGQAYDKSQVEACRLALEEAKAFAESEGGCLDEGEEMVIDTNVRVWGEFLRCKKIIAIHECE